MRIAAGILFACLLFPKSYDHYPLLISAFALGAAVRRPVNKQKVSSGH